MKLTKDQRAAFFASEWPELAGKGKPPAEVGYVHHLSSRLSFEVVRVHFKRGRWRLEYRVVDDREQSFFLVPMMTSLERMARAPLGDDGLPEMGPPEEDIGYTRDPRRVRADEARALRPDLQNVVRMRSKLKDAEYDRTERAEQQAREDARRLAATVRDTLLMMARNGVDSTEYLAGVQRAALKAQGEEQRAA